MNELTRREFLGASAALAALKFPAQDVKRIASVNTAYYVRSHAYHIDGRFIHGYPIQGVHHQPPFKLVRMYNDQYPPNDLSRGIAKKHGIELSKTVAEALGPVDVDGVLLIGEHGDYPVNERGQKMYPRHRLFMEIVDAFRKNKKSVPVFCDKHLSYDHQLAAEMVAASKELGFGLMAGSSVPVSWRRPELEPPIGTPFVEGLAVHASGVEHYGFHGLEGLQCMMERRGEMETGVRAVTCIQGPAVWKAGDDGVWSWDLLEAALSRCPSRNVGDVRDNVIKPSAFLIEYVDGARGTVLNLQEHVWELSFSFAGRVKGRKEPLSTLYEMPAPPGAKFFDPLVFNIEKLFATGRSPIPVERTLLTTTALDFAMRSLAAGGKRMESPALQVSYKPPADSGFFRGRVTDS